MRGDTVTKQEIRQVRSMVPDKIPCLKVWMVFSARPLVAGWKGVDIL